MFKKRYRFKKDKLQIVFEDVALKTFIENIQYSMRDNEKGGLLMGRLFPEENLIVVTNAIRIKSIKSGYTELYINLEEANKTIKEIWKKSGGKITYLGDWHTHPERAPLPSSIDYNTFRSTYRASKIDQDILLCAIVGTNTIEKKGLFVGIQSYFKFNKLLYSLKYNLFSKNKHFLVE